MIARVTITLEPRCMSQEFLGVTERVVISRIDPLFLFTPKFWPLMRLPTTMHLRKGCLWTPSWSALIPWGEMPDAVHGP